MKKLLMGNEAIAMGAIRAGVGFVAGYPGTPSTEVLETIAKNRTDDLYVEWSVNEKAAMEVAAGASYAGQRVMVTMKQVGLNVASDPLMCLSYVGIKGGFVVLVADDPGPISSQTEQDTRHFAEYAKLPIWDPSSPEEAFEMVQDAFEYSEQYGTPVILRSTTRVCHGCASIEIDSVRKKIIPEGFMRDSKWVIFPRLVNMNHKKIEARNEELQTVFSTYRFNQIEQGKGKLGIAVGGVSYSYVKEALGDFQIPILKIGTPHPFPEQLAVEFLKTVDEVMVFEELDPVIEQRLIYLCGKYRLSVSIRGKLTKDTTNAGENSVELIADTLQKYLNLDCQSIVERSEVPELPIRPPVLCAGCPHRASFYAVKQAMKGRKAVFSGDIGCYTLGNAAPLDMVDTCLCMGADVTIAQGLHRVEPDTVHFSFIGDSTFWASGMTGVVNAIYNQADIVLVVLDNSTTAMTGHQPHPGTGKTMMGNITEKVSIPKVLRAIGVESVECVDPMNLQEAKEAILRAADVKGVSAVVFESPCVALFRPEEQLTVSDKSCIGCKKCIRELGCPAISMKDGKAQIDVATCNGCTICAQVCPVNAIGREEK